tara:strand:- start:937 stop:2727 length:1791 start_codon:yes stop_codon:yes gene_type:complete
MSENKRPQDNLRVLNLSSYEAPEVKETYNKDWISWGADNDYFGRLIDLDLSSPTNSRCNNGIADMIYGRGLESTNSSLFPEDYVRMRKLLRPKEVKKLVVDRKKLGQGALKLTYNEGKTKILKVSHFPMETLRAAKCNDKGVITAYYYHPKWKELQSIDKPKRIPTFGNGSSSQKEELYIVKPYRSGFYYYSTPDYQACLQYADLECEVSNYHISNIQNGLSPSLFIQFNNGVPNEETQSSIEKRINDKFGGSSKAGTTIIGFNDSAETAATIEAIHLPDAHAQYQFLSDEAREKIMLGHGIVSPILLGIKDNTGFGNNAEELRTASVLMDNVIIRPFQDEIKYALEEILEFNNIHQDIYFVTLQPIEFTQLDNISTKIRKEEETGEKLSKIELEDFSDNEGEDMINQLDSLGEVLSDDWEVVHSEVYNEDRDSLSATELSLDSKSWVERLAIKANPSKKSKEDDEVYKIRYAYMPERKSANSRGFCKRMESITGRSVVFRKEDINMMSFRGVNKELGHNKQNYSLLKYKGGKNCHHYWELRVYKKKGGKEVNPQNAYTKGLNQPNNPSEMTEKMVDRADKGAYRSILNKLKSLFN